MRTIYIVLLIGAVSLGAVLWKISLFQQPFNESEIPEWQVQEIDAGTWKVFALDEPHRQTTAWIEGNPDNAQCDTIVIMGGLEEGRNLAVGAEHIPERANIVALRHPINQFFETHPWKQWTWWEWLSLPMVLKNEMAHTVGALRATADYVNGGQRNDSRFTDKVILAGGSFGSPFPVILASFQPEQTAALMVIYGFTNYQFVITSELTRQGLIHFNLEPTYQLFSNPLHGMKVIGVKVLARILGFLLGNMFKYGYMELYFPQIAQTPIYFINGKEDHLVPKKAYQPMWESAPEPKYQVWAKGDHIRPGEPEEVRRLVNHMRDWGRSQNLWMCR
ncbi:MAG: hypothetical protein HQM14_15215 [SAR324 cluster bacterium]|nr:hypothetical protein [SAR324 cluster bacterium]